MPGKRTPYISGDPSTAHLVLVGEAPGEDETVKGGAFVDRAGKLLNELMASAGFVRSACYLDNVFQFHPPGNNLDSWIKLNTTKARTTVKESPEFLQQKENLLERLRETKANVVVALGNISLYALTGLASITKRRGSILQCDALGGRKVIPCIHPSAAFHDYLFRYNIVVDLQRAWEEKEFPETRLLKRNLNLEPTLHEAISFIQLCQKFPQVAYDIEVKNQELSHLAIATNPTSGMCIPFISGEQDYWTPDQEAEIIQAIARLLEDERVEKIGQNLSFDSTFMYSKYGIHVKPMQDTMIAAGILLPDFPKGLDSLVSNYCDGEPYYKDDGKEWFNNPFKSEEIFRRYNAMDAAVLMEIFPKQQAELERSGNWGTYKNQLRLLEPLVYAGNKGMKVSRKKMKDFAKGAEKKIQELEAALLEATGGQELNPNSSKQMKEYFYVQKGLPPYTRKGAITVDDKALKRISAKGLREAGIILALRHEKKMLSTYYDMKLDTDERLRCSFNPVGTSQGRISSSKTIRGTGANMQNQPDDMKAVMVPDDGFIMVNQDLSQAENRVVAYISGEYRMLDAFQKGIDIHIQTGALVHGIPISDVTDDIRADGKKANHGLNYDLGYVTFALLYQITEAEAKHIIARYHAVYPAIREWHSAIRQELSMNGSTLTNCFGRRRRFLGQWGHDLFKLAYSYIPQSTVADVMNQRGFSYLYYNQDLFPEVQFLNTVHDSLQYQIPLEVGYKRIIEIIQTIKQNLEIPIKWKDREFSIPVDTKMGFSLDEKTMIEWKAKDTIGRTTEDLSKELAVYVETNGELDSGVSTLYGEHRTSGGV